MKNLFMVMALISSFSAFAGDPLRDLKKDPLTKIELIAFDAAKEMGESMGADIRHECVNASYTPGSFPVSIQFWDIDWDGQESCVDPHFSIEVNITAEGEVLSVSLIDS